MARVEADPEPGVAVEPVEERDELVERAADRPARAGGVLHQEPRCRAALEDLAHRGADAVDPGVEAGAEVGADVEDDGVRVDRAGDVDGVPHRRDGLRVHLLVGRGEVTR